MQNHLTWREKQFCDHSVSVYWVPPYFSCCLYHIIYVRLTKDRFTSALPLFYFSCLVDLRYRLETKIFPLMNEWMFLNVENFINKINHDWLQCYCYMTTRHYVLTHIRINNQPNVSVDNSPIKKIIYCFTLIGP